MIWSSWDFQPEHGTLKEEISIDSRPERVFVGVSYRDYMFLCCSMVTTTPNANPTVTMKLMYALYALYALESWVGNAFPRYNIIVIQYDLKPIVYLLFWINPKSIFPSNTMCSRFWYLYWEKRGSYSECLIFFDPRWLQWTKDPNECLNPLGSLSNITLWILKKSIFSDYIGVSKNRGTPKWMI